MLAINTNQRLLSGGKVAFAPPSEDLLFVPTFGLPQLPQKGQPQPQPQPQPQAPPPAPPPAAPPASVAPVNTQNVQNFINTRFIPILRPQQPRVFQANPKAGVMAAKGTLVDITLSQRDYLDFTIFDTVHDDFKARLMTDILPVVEHPDVLPLLERAQHPEELSPAEQTVIKSHLPAGITVDDTKAGKSFALAFNTLQAAKLFR